MVLSSYLNIGIFEKLDRLCGSVTSTYPIKSRISDINEALDWYFGLAFQADRRWTFDDMNKTSPPIDTQNIVSGTNRYKLSSFAEKIVNLIKLEILDADGQGLELIPETMDELGSSLSGNTSGRINGIGGGSFQELYLDTSNTGTPTHYIKYGDFIYLRPFPNYSETSGLKAYFNRPASKFEFVSCQPEADDELITATAHGLSANDTVLFEVASGGTISGGITADTTYYVIATDLTANAFKISTTLGGSAVNITSDGSGVNFLKLNGEPGMTSLHHDFIVRKAALTQLSFVDSNKLGWLPQQVLKDERTIGDFYAYRDEDAPKRIIPLMENNE